VSFSIFEFFCLEKIFASLSAQGENTSTLRKSSENAGHDFFSFSKGGESYGPAELTPQNAEIKRGRSRDFFFRGVYLPTMQRGPFAGFYPVSQLPSLPGEPERWAGRHSDGKLGEILLGDSALIDKASVLPQGGPWGVVLTGEDQDGAWVVLPGELVCSLTQLRGKLNARAAFLVGYLILEALEPVHREAKSHGRIAPEHIGFDAQGVLRVRARPGSPEVADLVLDADPIATDCWAVGGVIHNLLGGEWPPVPGAELPEFEGMDAGRAKLALSGLLRSSPRLRLTPAQFARQAVGAALQDIDGAQEDLAEALSSHGVGNLLRDQAPVLPSGLDDEGNRALIEAFTKAVAPGGPARKPPPAHPSEEAASPVQIDLAPVLSEEAPLEEGATEQEEAQQEDAADAPQEEEAQEQEEASQEEVQEQDEAIDDEEAQRPLRIQMPVVDKPKTAIVPKDHPEPDDSPLEIEPFRMPLPEPSPLVSASTPVPPAAAEEEPAATENLIEEAQPPSITMPAPPPNVDKQAEESVEEEEEPVAEEAPSEEEEEPVAEEAPPEEEEEPVAEEAPPEEEEPQQKLTVSLEIPSPQAAVDLTLINPPQEEQQSPPELLSEEELDALLAEPLPDEAPEADLSSAVEVPEDLSSLRDPASGVDEDWPLGVEVGTKSDLDEDLGPGKWVESGRTAEELSRELDSIPVVERGFDLDAGDSAFPRILMVFGLIVLGLFAVWKATTPDDSEPEAPQERSQDLPVLEADPVDAIEMEEVTATITSNLEHARVSLDGISYGRVPASVPLPKDTEIHKLCVEHRNRGRCVELSAEELAAREPYQITVE